jgi:hypothetical protein
MEYNMFIPLLLEFLSCAVAEPSRWYAVEVPAIHRLFPAQALAMVELWLESSPYLLSSLDDDLPEAIFSDVEMFIPYFERALEAYGIKCDRVYSVSTYNRSQYPFKYKLSKFRLTKSGLLLYTSLLP